MDERPKFDKPPKVISHFSGDFTRNRQEDKRGTEYFQYKNVFGMIELVKVLEANNKINKEDGMSHISNEVRYDPNLSELPGMKEALLVLRKKLANKVKNPASAYAVQEFFMEAFADTDLRQQLLPLVRRNQPVTTLKVEDIPDKIFLEMVLNHVGYYGGKVEAFREREKKLRKSFLKNLQKLINNGTLSLDLSNAVARINQHKVHLRDVLEQDLADMFGEVDPSRDLVHISAQLPEDLERYTYNHEMVHVISGKAAIFIAIEDNVDINQGLVKREGVVISHRGGFTRGDGINSPKFFWLNEAVTDNIALMFSDKNEGPAYPNEKELLRQLMKRGKRLLSRKLLQDAYFEDTHEGDIYTVTPIMQKFFQTVDEAYGVDGFIEKLDDYVTQHGVEKAIETLKSDPKQI